MVIASDSAKDIEAAKAFGLPCKFLLLDAATVSRRFPIHGHVTHATYYRVFLPALLAAEYDRLLYLDTDIYVHSAPIFGLLSLDMGGNAIAGVHDLWTCFMDTGPAVIERRDALSKPDNKYVNAGVLLIDVAAYAEREIERKAVAAIVAGKVQLGDQSAINRALDGDWLPLSPAFNTTGLHWQSFSRKVLEPVIVHFAGSAKPWHGPRFAADHPARGDMERYLVTTPWKGFFARFYSFKDAWSALGRQNAPGATPPARIVSPEPLKPVEAKRFAEHLRTTAFADVEQGITTLHLEFIPPGL